MAHRDDFSQSVKDALAKRAGFLCSNPDCLVKLVSSGGDSDHSTISLGVAAHICAAAPGGPRYDSEMSREERASIQNAIFLCPTCATLIDKNNGSDYPGELLRYWKSVRELNAKQELAKPPTKTESTFSVTSYGQVGGITAGQVNIGPVPRILTSELKNQLLKEIPVLGRPLEIHAVLGDEECYRFGKQIHDFLAQHGRVLQPMSQSMFDRPQKGLVYNPDVHRIVVGPES